MLPSAPSDRTADSLEDLAISLRYKANAKSDYIEIPFQEYMDSFNLHNTMGGVWTGELALVDGHGESLEQVSATFGMLTKFEIKFGRRGSHIPTWSSIATDARISIESNAFHATYALLADVPLYANTAPTAPASYAKSGDPVRYLNTVLKQAGLAETSKGDGSRIAYNCKMRADITWKAGQPALAFLSNLAANTMSTDAATKDQPYVFSYDSERSRVTFAPQKAFDALQGMGARTHDYIYARDPMGEVVSVAFNDGGLWAAYSGGAGTGGTFDGPIIGTGAHRLTDKTPGHAPSGDAIAVPVGNVLSTNLGGNGFSIRLPAMFNDDLRDAAMAAWSAKIQQGTIQVVMVVRGTHDVSPFDMVRLVYRPLTYGRNHFLTNLYRVTDVEHALAPGSWITTFHMYAESLPAAVKSQQPSTPTVDAKAYNLKNASDGWMAPWSNSGQR